MLWLIAVLSAEALALFVSLCEMVFCIVKRLMLSG